MYQYWGSRAGTSCYAYANAFYATFYDGTYPHGSLNGNHQKVKATGKITYANFVKWGVRNDAAVYIREGNHSVIVLHYDEKYITYVDGNGDGNGLIALRKEAWKRSKGSNIYNEKPSLIVQPKTSYFAAGSMGKKAAVPCTQGGTSHDWDEGKVTKQPDCAGKGQKLYTCADCGKTETESYGKATDHSYGSWEVTKAATCAAAGVKTATCKYCGKTKTKTISAKEHTYGKWTETKAATCTAKGDKEAVCDLCGKKKTKAVSALGHDYGKTTAIKAATVYSYGRAEKTCARCQKVKTVKSDCLYQEDALGITLTMKEKVFAKNTEVLAVASQEEQSALQEITGKYAVYTLSASKKEEPVQPKGTVILTMDIPEDFGDNVALYAMTEEGAQKIESTVETGVLTAELTQLGTLALCDLDVPYVPPETTEPTTQPTTESVTQPVTVAEAPEQTTREEAATDLLLWALAATVPVAAIATLVISLVTKKRKKIPVE